MSTVVFTRTDPRLGVFALRPLDVAADAALLHGWVTHPKAAFWMMQDAEPADVAAEYGRIAADPHHEAFLGLHEGRPAFLAERYDPSTSNWPASTTPSRATSACTSSVRRPTQPVHGFTLAVITTVLAWLFADPAVRRVVVEPDVRNTAVHALNAAVGFDVAGPITKPEKRALLSFCTRDRFLTTTGLPDPARGVTA